MRSILFVLAVLALAMWETMASFKLEGKQLKHLGSTQVQKVGVAHQSLASFISQHLQVSNGCVKNCVNSAFYTNATNITNCRYVTNVINCTNWYSTINAINTANSSNVRNVTNCSFVSRSSFIINGTNITNSSYVNNSKNCSNCYNSTNLTNCINVTNSRNLTNSTKCTNCVNSWGIINSTNVSMSRNSSNLINCTNVTNVRNCVNCSNARNADFKKNFDGIKNCAFLNYLYSAVKLQFTSCTGCADSKMKQYAGELYIFADRSITYECGTITWAGIFSVINRHPVVKESFHMPSEAELRALFDQIDKDHNGAIDIHEMLFWTSMRGYVVSQEEINDYYANDENKDSQLSFEEFKAMIFKDLAQN